jgi:hypothetical protein
MATNPRGTPLSLGSVQFYDEEHPDELPLELQQVMAVHQIPGGGKVIQSLGPQMPPVTWKGNLVVVGSTTPNARIFQINRMHASGSVQRLSYGPFAYDVVVKYWKPVPKNANWATYEITVEILRDVSGQFYQAPLLSVDTQTQTAMSQIQTRYTNLAVSDPTTSGWLPAITLVASQLSTLGPIASALPSQTLPIISNARLALNLVTPYVNGLSNIGLNQAQSYNLGLAVGIQSNLTLIIDSVRKHDAVHGSQPAADTHQAVRPILHAYRLQHPAQRARRD